MKEEQWSEKWRQFDHMDIILYVGKLWIVYLVVLSKFAFLVILHCPQTTIFVVVIVFAPRAAEPSGSSYSKWTATVLTLPLGNRILCYDLSGQQQFLVDKSSHLQCLSLNPMMLHSCLFTIFSNALPKCLPTDEVFVQILHASLMYHDTAGDAFQFLAFRRKK